MKFRRIATGFACAALLAAGGVATPAAEPDRISPAALSELSEIERPVLLADFENGTDWRLGYRVLSGGKGSVSTGQLEAPAIPGSNAYLFVNFRADAATGLRVRPPKPVRLVAYVRRFEFWIMGTGRADEAFLDLIDATGRSHRLSAGRLDFSGWRKLRVVPGPGIRQRAADGRTGIEFRGLYLQPAPRPTSGRFSLFSLRVYADHFIAITRDHLRQPADRWRDLNL